MAARVALDLWKSPWSFGAGIRGIFIEDAENLHHGSEAKGAGGAFSCQVVQWCSQLANLEPSTRTEGEEMQHAHLCTLCPVGGRRIQYRDISEPASKAESTDAVDYCKFD